MQLQKKSPIFAANSVWSLVVTGLGFTSFFTRRLAVYKLLWYAEGVPIYCFVLQSKCTFFCLTTQKGKQKGGVI